MCCSKRYPNLIHGNFAVEQTHDQDSCLYGVELTGDQQNCAGNLYELDYQQHFALHSGMLRPAVGSIVDLAGCGKLTEKAFRANRSDKYFGRKFVRYQMHNP